MPMVDTFTSLQLIRYTYLECSQTESQVLEECAASDPSLKEEVTLLMEAKRFLPKALFSAHPNSIQHILEYSRTWA